MILPTLLCSLLINFVTATTPALPLHTQSRWIIDNNGTRVKLACVNWYGAHMENYVVNGEKICSIAYI
jgi:endoglucanase